MAFELTINEVFTSINGEVSPCKQGSIATFIRLATGCNLQCPWCDTKNHTEIKARLRRFDVKDAVQDLNHLNKNKPLAKNITITGGEPLLAYELQPKPFFYTVESLSESGHHIAIETNGTYRLPENVRNLSGFKGFVVDYKFFLLDKGWKVEKAFAAGADLCRDDYVKLVIDKEHHIGLAKQFLSYYTSLVAPEHHPTFAVSIINEGGNHFLNPMEVIESFVDDGYDFLLLNTQIHKFLQIP